LDEEKPNDEIVDEAELDDGTEVAIIARAAAATTAIVTPIVTSLLNSDIISFAGMSVGYSSFLPMF
jgi:hypothetical protein